MLEDRPLVPVCYESRNMAQRNYLTVVSTDLGGTYRAFHNVVRACNQVRFLFTNYYNGGAGETNLPTGNGPGAITVSASMEDPTSVGVPLFQLTFNGASSVTIAPGGFALSDPIDYDFAAGASIWLRTFVQIVTGGFYFPCNGLVSSQFNYPSGLGWNTGDSSTVGTNYVQDGGNGANALTTSGTAWITGATSYAKGYTATAVLGVPVSTTPTTPLAIVGDSIAGGFQDTLNGEIGWIVRWARLMGVPPMLLASNSELMSTIGLGQTNYRVRRTLVQYCSHALIAYGVNDIFTAGTSLATLKTYLQQAITSLTNRGLTVYVSTITPNTSGSWASTGAQSKRAQETVRTGYNAYLRSWPQTNDPILSKVAGIIDAAAAVEVGIGNTFDPYGGLWYCGPANSTAYTSDGLHPNPAANALMAAKAFAQVPSLTYPARQLRDRFGDFT